MIDPLQTQNVQMPVDSVDKESKLGWIAGIVVLLVLFAIAAGLGLWQMQEAVTAKGQVADLQAQIVAKDIAAKDFNEKQVRTQAKIEIFQIFMELGANPEKLETIDQLAFLADLKAKFEATGDPLIEEKFGKIINSTSSLQQDAAGADFIVYLAQSMGK